MRAVSLNWVGGESDFALTLPLLEALQSRCDGDGVGLIYTRLAAGHYKLQDILATVALGLEGGGMEKRNAVKKVTSLYEDHGLTKLHITAHAVIGYAINGWPDDEPDASTAEGEAGVETPKTSST